MDGSQTTLSQCVTNWTSGRDFSLLIRGLKVRVLRGALLFPCFLGVSWHSGGCYICSSCIAGVAPRGHLTPMTARFAKSSIQAIAPAESGRIDDHGAEQRDLILRSSASGKRAFYFYGKLNGRPPRMVSGEFPEVTISRAGERCRDLPSEPRLDEPQVSQNRRGAITFGRMWEN